MTRWRLTDVILLALLAFLFGGVFMGAGYLYVVLELALTPSGNAAFANELLFGLWVMAAPMIGMLLRKRWSALLGEVLAALAEMLMGSHFGVGVLISGLVQGFGSELGFWATRYRRYDICSLTLGAIATTLLSYLYEYFKLGYQAYGLGRNLALLGIRFVSVYLFGVVVVLLVLRLLKRSGFRVDKSNG